MTDTARTEPDDVADSDTEPGIGGSLFDEPASFRPSTPPPHFVDFALASPALPLRLRLVGHNPLWGHHLWNAGRVLSEHIQAASASPSSSSSLSSSSSSLVRGRDVLELGAGAGLPGLTAWVCGARSVVLSDYPDQDLVENLHLNIRATKDAVREACLVRAGTEAGSEQGDSEEEEESLFAQGYLWGAPLVDKMTGGFDVVILGDLLFNHSEHEKLIRSVQMALRKDRDSVAMVFFTPYRPWLLEKDLAFFDLASSNGFRVLKANETVMPEVMFEEDQGDELLRRTVYAYELRWEEEALASR